jgi:hypothetical protein
MSLLHTFQDDSKLLKINVKELISIPIWRGNRHIDLTHAENIRKEIGNSISILDSSVFRTVVYREDGVEQKYLIDGQHRRYVLQKYFEENLCIPTFDILVIEKRVEGESEAIEYFNILNNVKPQHEHDTKLLANKYILQLEKQFNSKKNLLIKPEGKSTKRPYLSSDSLRECLEKHSDKLKQSNIALARFIQKVVKWNSDKLKEFEVSLVLSTIKEKDESVLKSCLEKKFVLAFDPKLPWIQECLD